MTSVLNDQISDEPQETKSIPQIANLEEKIAVCSKSLSEIQRKLNDIAYFRKLKLIELLFDEEKCNKEISSSKEQIKKYTDYLKNNAWMQRMYEYKKIKDQKLLEEQTLQKNTVLLEDITKTKKEKDTELASLISFISANSSKFIFKKDPSAISSALKEIEEKQKKLILSKNEQIDRYKKAIRCLNFFVDLFDKMVASVELEHSKFRFQGRLEVISVREFDYLDTLKPHQIIIMCIEMYNDLVREVYCEGGGTFEFSHFRGHECSVGFGLHHRCDCGTDDFEKISGFDEDSLLGFSWLKEQKSFPTLLNSLTEWIDQHKIATSVNEINESMDEMIKQRKYHFIGRISVDDCSHDDNDPEMPHCNYIDDNGNAKCRCSHCKQNDDDNDYYNSYY